MSGPVSFDGPLLATLRYRDFRNLWFGSFASYAGQWIQQATIAWLAYELSGSAALVGAAVCFVLDGQAEGGAGERGTQERHGRGGSGGLDEGAAVHGGGGGGRGCSA